MSLSTTLIVFSLIFVSGVVAIYQEPHTTPTTTTTTTTTEAPTTAAEECLNPPSTTSFPPYGIETVPLDDHPYVDLRPRPAWGQSPATTLNVTRIRTSTSIITAIIGITPTLRALARFYFPPANIYVIAEHLSSAMHEQLHQYTRVAFYCMLVIGGSAITFGVLAFIRIRRRRARLAREAEEAQKRLGDLVSIL